MLEDADRLARQLFESKFYAEATMACDIVLSLSNRSWPALLNAARCNIYAQKPEIAEAQLREARKHMDRPMGDRTDLELLVLALGWLGRHNEAEEILKTLPESNQTKYNLGWHMLRHGKFKEAQPLLEHGKMIGVWGDRDFMLPTPKWTGTESLEGKSILLNLERGLGDHIIQVRHARDLKARGATVIVKTHPSLVMILSQAEGVDQATTQVPEHDYWIGGMSVAGALGLSSPGGKSYLKPLPFAIDIWKEILGEKKRPRIALRWQGNPAFEHEQMRTIPVEVIVSKLCDLGELYSVQRDAGSEKCPPDVIDLSQKLKSWEDTTAALSLMDVVVTSCTSVTHAAAALGVPVVVITPIVSYYPWTDETVYPKTPWYDSVLIAKQKKIREWGEAIDEARGHVETILRTRI